jgi:flavin reductase
MAPDPLQFRQAASRFLTGVTVVGSIGPDGPVAMTANSFVTVSVNPPMVLVSLMAGRTLAAIEATGRYCVSVLPAEAVQATRHFAGKPVLGAVPVLAEDDGFAVLPDALAVFACDVVQAMTVADHRLVIGQVRWCRQSDGVPLSFYASQFHAGAGEVIRA